jgi:hypothetical protein
LIPEGKLRTTLPFCFERVIMMAIKAEIETSKEPISHFYSRKTLLLREHR